MRKILRNLLSAVLAGVLLTGMLAVPAGAVSGFSDVPESHWAAAAISRAAQTGLVRGVSATRFGMGRSMTRAAFTVVVCRLFGWEQTAPAAGSFTDNQDPSKWYYAAVETAVSHGAVTLQSEKFRPSDPITREEIAVMLVRALGCGTIAGATLELGTPFSDVESNAGYITMAYQMGIVSGRKDGTFRPETTATREQAVVMLMRVYDKLHAAAPEVSGLAGSAAGLTDQLGRLNSAVLIGGTVTAEGVAALPSGDAEALRAKIRAAGGKALLGLTGTAAALSGTGAAAAVAGAAADYDGVQLELTALGADSRGALTALAGELKTALGGKLLYLTVPAPSWNGVSYGGYDYAALGKLADRLVVRIEPCGKTVNGVYVAAQEPLEEIYYGLTELKKSVAAAKLSVLLTTTGTAVTSGQAGGVRSAAQIEALLKGGAVSRYVGRYAGDYLVSGNDTVWYLGQDAATVKIRFIRFLGVSAVCLSDLTSVADWDGYSLPAVLWGA